MLFDLLATLDYFLNLDAVSKGVGESVRTNMITYYDASRLWPYVFTQGLSWQPYYSATFLVTCKVTHEASLVGSS